MGCWWIRSRGSSRHLPWVLMEGVDWWGDIRWEGGGDPYIYTVQGKVVMHTLTREFLMVETNWWGVTAWVGLRLIHTRTGTRWWYIHTCIHMQYSGLVMRPVFTAVCVCVVVDLVDVVVVRAAGVTCWRCTVLMAGWDCYVWSTVWRRC